jgi:hypothetical protein
MGDLNPRSQPPTGKISSDSVSSLLVPPFKIKNVYSYLLKEKSVYTVNAKEKLNFHLKGYASKIHVIKDSSRDKSTKQGFSFVCSMFKFDKIPVIYSMKNQLIWLMHTPNKSLDFGLKGYESDIIVLQRMFAGWKQKAGVPICMQWTSLSNSG